MQNNVLLRQQAGRRCPGLAAAGAERRSAGHGERCGHRDRSQRHAAFRRAGPAAGAGPHAGASRARCWCWTTRSRRWTAAPRIPCLPTCRSTPRIRSSSSSPTGCTIFPQMQRVIFMEDGKTTVGTHEELLAAVPAYRQLYESQTGGKQHEERTIKTACLQPSAWPPWHTICSLWAHVLCVAASVVGVAAAAAAAGPHHRRADGRTAADDLRRCLSTLAAWRWKGVLSSAQESLLVLFGQKMTHALRSEMSRKLTQLPAQHAGGPEPRRGGRALLRRCGHGGGAVHLRHHQHGGGRLPHPFHHGGHRREKSPALR